MTEKESRTEPLPSKSLKVRAKINSVNGISERQTEVLAKGKVPEERSHPRSP